MKYTLLALFCTHLLFAIDVRTSIPLVYHDGEHEIIGTLTLDVKGNDFPAATPQKRGRRHDGIQYRTLHRIVQKTRRHADVDQAGRSRFRKRERAVGKTQNSRFRCTRTTPKGSPGGAPGDPRRASRRCRNSMGAVWKT